MAQWLTPQSQFTDLQKQIYQQIFENISEKKKYSALIEGPPGTGKTLILAQLALQNTDLRGILFIYTKVLVQFLNNALASTGELFTNSNTMVINFDKWLWDLHRQELPDKHRRISSGDQEYAEKKDLIIQNLDGKLNKVFDFVFIDEGQDFSPRIVSFIKRLSNKIIFTGDLNQSLYEKHDDKLGDLREVLQPDDNFLLEDVVRVSPSRIHLLQNFIIRRYPNIRVRKRETDKNPIKDSKPLWFYNINEDLFLNYFIKNVAKNYLRDGKSVAVITFNKKDVNYLYDSILEILDEPEVVELVSSDSLGFIDFNEKKIYCLTLLSSKGTEFDNVLYYISKHTIYHTNDTSLIENMAYTAYTRAIEDLIVYSPERNIPLMQDMNLNYISEISEIPNVQEDDEETDLLI